MPRLPQPGSDNGTWGNVLNEYLSQSLNPNGTLKDNIITTTHIADGTITELHLDASTQNKLNTAGSGNVADGTITTAKLHDGAVVDSKVDPSAAIAQSKIANLTTDLAGKAAAVHAHTASDITDSTATGRLLMAATDASAARTVLALNNIDNTSDATKNSASATLANKTLNSTNTVTLSDSNFTLQDNSDATKQARFEVSSIATGSTRTYTLPNGDTTLVGTGLVQTLTNKAISITDTNLTIQDNTDTSKQLRFELSGISTNTTHTLTVPNASGTIALTSDIVAGGDASTNTTTSVDGEVALFNGTTGKSLKRATGTGMAKLTSGVLSAGTAGTDYTTPSSTETLSNKTISGLNNTFSNIGISAIGATGTPSGSTYLRGDGTWSTPSGGSGDGTDTGALMPEDFGAVGDGTTNDTTAMQAWLDAVTAGDQQGMLKAGKVYRIQSVLEIGEEGSNWSIDGQRATILQATDGQGIFTFTVENIHSFDIRNMQWEWVNSQDSGDGTIGVSFDTGGSALSFGWFNFLFENIRLINGYRGFQTLENSNINGVWNCTFRRIWSTYGNKGTLFRFRNGQSGQPAIHIEDCYMHRELSTEPVIDIALGTGLHITNIEINGENQTAENGIVLSYCFGVYLSGRIERGTLNGTGLAVVVLSNCKGVTVGTIDLQAVQAFSGTVQSLFKLESTVGFNLVSASLTTYAPNPSYPASFAIVQADGPSSIAGLNAALQGSAYLCEPLSKLPTLVIADNSIPVAKLTNGSTTPDSSKFYRGDGTWQTVSGGSSSTTPRKQSVMALGDSLSAVVSDYNSTLGVDSHLGNAGGHSPGDWLFLGNLLAGSPLDILGSAATAGYTVDQIRDTHLPTVLAAKPEYCICFSLGGNNILASGEFASSVLTVSKYIIDQLAAAGVTPILATLPPVSSGNVSQNEIARYNSWMMNYAHKNGYPILDFYSILVDSATGVYKSGFTSDNTHPNSTGAAAMAPVVRDLLTKLSITGTRATLASYNGSITGQLSNPLLIRTGGAANTPDGWASSSVTLGLAASSSWPGNEWTLTSTGSLGYALGPTLSVTSGDEWDVSFRLSTTPAGSGGWGFGFYNQSASLVVSAGSTSTANPTAVPADTIVHLRGKVSSGVTSMQPLIYAMGTGSVIKIGQYTFRNLSAMSILS